MLKRIILFAAILLLPLMAEGKRLELYYIAHDHYGSELSLMLRNVRRTARYNSDRTVIFFLADGNESRYFVVSPDDEEDYEAFDEALNSQTRHNTYPESDRLLLIDKFSQDKKWGGPGFDAFETIVFNFYINSGFIELDYCDGLIGHLYWDMELDTLPQGKLEMNIYIPVAEATRKRMNASSLFSEKKLLGGFEPLVMTF